jgi:2,5-diamino-6-(ribosylamino)-4(3H)-pyrimidinone 5'-phosphate reductase
MAKKMKAEARPHVICLMQISVDGKIMIDRWPDPDAAEGDYERAHDQHKADAWLCGRVVMAYFARNQQKAKHPPAIVRPVRQKTDFIAPGKAGSYAVAVDAAGKLKWRSTEINGDRLITLLSHRVSRAYLADLQSKGISYLITGRGGQLDFRAALTKLRDHFGIRKLMLEGGGKINGSFLHAGLIDELSLLVSPVTDGDSATTGLFETNPMRKGLRSRGLVLRKVSRRPGGVLWLRYQVQNR